MSTNKSVVKRAAKASVPKVIFPKTLNTRLVFYDFFTMSTGITSYNTVSLRANSCRDPVVAAGGGSPSGFTALSAMYYNYKVSHVNVEVWGWTQVTIPLIVGIYFRSSKGVAVASGAAAQQTLMERPDLCVQTTTLPYEGWGSFKVRGSKDIALIEGRALVDDNYLTTFAVEPTLQCYADVIVVAADGAATGISIDAHIRVTYTLECSQPNTAYLD